MKCIKDQQMQYTLCKLRGFVCSSWGPNCSRCFHITLRSRNVLQVRTEGLDKCYTNEDAAEATCPDENTAQFKDIILYSK